MTSDSRGRESKNGFTLVKYSLASVFNPLYMLSAASFNTKIDFGNIIEIRKLTTFEHFIANKKPT